METTAPRTNGEESGLRTWPASRRVDAHKELRENDATFQLEPTRVGTTGKIDRRAGVPIFLPSRARLRLNIGERDMGRGYD